MELLGIGAALLALIGFVCNQYHLVDTDNIWYDSINLLSGFGLFMYAYSIDSLPFMLTNTVWMVVSGLDVIRYILGYRPRKRLRRRR